MAVVEQKLEHTICNLKLKLLPSFPREIPKYQKIGARRANFWNSALKTLIFVLKGPTWEQFLHDS